jgi:hypothetical protein
VRYYVQDAVGTFCWFTVRDRETNDKATDFIFTGMINAFQVATRLADAYNTGTLVPPAQSVEWGLTGGTTWQL